MEQEGEFHLLLLFLKKFLEKHIVVYSIYKGDKNE